MAAQITIDLKTLGVDSEIMLEYEQSKHCSNSKAPRESRFNTSSAMNCKVLMEKMKTYVEKKMGELAAGDVMVSNGTTLYFYDSCKALGIGSTNPKEEPDFIIQAAVNGSKRTLEIHGYPTTRLNSNYGIRIKKVGENIINF